MEDAGGMSRTGKRRTSRYREYQGAAAQDGSGGRARLLDFSFVEVPLFCWLIASAVKCVRWWLSVEALPLLPADAPQGQAIARRARTQGSRLRVVRFEFALDRHFARGEFRTDRRRCCADSAFVGGERRDGFAGGG